jgi:hypothetical protein
LTSETSNNFIHNKTVFHYQICHLSVSVFSIYIFPPIVKIPLEVLAWDIDRRRRYKNNIKLGKQKVYDARGMLVGCTGAGKTSLLRKLLRRSVTDQEQPPESTFVLEIHEDFFDIVEGSLQGWFTFQTSNQ